MQKCHLFPVNDKRLSTLNFTANNVYMVTPSSFCFFSWHIVDDIFFLFVAISGRREYFVKNSCSLGLTCFYYSFMAIPLVSPHHLSSVFFFFCRNL